ncbi:MAG TPA: hypothetical protein VN607_08240 [Gemmatimonadaceae bacterium]|nr:hypothetical protein [Gemmatimonadaceae bacterium]
MTVAAWCKTGEPSVATVAMGIAWGCARTGATSVRTLGAPDATIAPSRAIASTAVATLEDFARIGVIAGRTCALHTATSLEFDDTAADR